MQITTMSRTRLLHFLPLTVLLLPLQGCSSIGSMGFAVSFLLPQAISGSLRKSYFSIQPSCATVSVSRSQRMFIPSIVSCSQGLGENAQMLLQAWAEKHSVAVEYISDQKEGIFTCTCVAEAVGLEEQGKGATKWGARLEAAHAAVLAISGSRPDGVPAVEFVYSRAFKRYRPTFMLLLNQYFFRFAAFTTTRYMTYSCC